MRRGLRGVGHGQDGRAHLADEVHRAVAGAPAASVDDAGRPTILRVVRRQAGALLQNADYPTRYIQTIDYEAPEEIEVNRQRFASDARLQGFCRLGVRSLAMELKSTFAGRGQRGLT
jgi:hypothetical protein